MIHSFFERQCVKYVLFRDSCKWPIGGYWFSFCSAAEYFLRVTLRMRARLRSI